MDTEMTFTAMAQKLADIEEMLTEITIRMGKPDMAAHQGLWEAVATAEGKTRNAKRMAYAESKKEQGNG